MRSERLVKMEKELIWSNEDEYVYGRQVEFTSKDDFIATVKERYMKDRYEDGECNVVDVTIQPCIYSERTIPGDHLVPLSLVDYCIENYYTARVVPIE